MLGICELPLHLRQSFVEKTSSCISTRASAVRQCLVTSTKLASSCSYAELLPDGCMRSSWILLRPALICLWHTKICSCPWGDAGESWRVSTAVPAFDAGRRKLFLSSPTGAAVHHRVTQIIAKDMRQTRPRVHIDNCQLFLSSAIAP